jgi:hypothetical protein
MELISRNITLGGQRVEIFADLNYKLTPKSNPYTGSILTASKFRAEVKLY